MHRGLNFTRTFCTFRQPSREVERKHPENVVPRGRPARRQTEFAFSSCPSSGPYFVMFSPSFFFSSFHPLNASLLSLKARPGFWPELPFALTFFLAAADVQFPNPVTFHLMKLDLLRPRQQLVPSLRRPAGGPSFFAFYLR